MSWRTHSAKIIAGVIKETGSEDQAKLKKALRDAYPFGPRSHFPYKIWCEEIRYALGLKKRFERIPGVKHEKREKVAGQKELF